MSASFPPIFIGVIAFFIVFIIFVLLTALLYSKGEVVRIWAKRVSYFHRMKNNRAMRVKIRRELIQALTPDIEKILDKLIFVDVKNQKKNPDVPEDLVEYWTNIKADLSKFKIWCYHFKRSWNVERLGVKGRTVYAFCIFAVEEMAKKFGRHTLLQGRFIEEPLLVHAPSLEQYIDKQVQKAELRGEQLTSVQLKKLRKSYKHNSKETYLATLFVPTTLSDVEENALMGRISDFGNSLKIIMYGLDAFGTKLAKYDILEYTVKRMLKIQRQMELKIHAVKDVVGHKCIELDEMEDINKQLKIPARFSPMHEEFPVIPTPKAEAGPTTQFKKKLENASILDFMFWVITLITIIFGLAFTIFGAVLLVTGSSSGIPLIAIGVIFNIVFFVSYLWKKRGEQVPQVKPTKPFEPKKEVSESGE